MSIASDDPTMTGYLFRCKMNDQQLEEWFAENKERIIGRTLEDVKSFLDRHSIEYDVRNWGNDRKKKQSFRGVLLTVRADNIVDLAMSATQPARFN